MPKRQRKHITLKTVVSRDIPIFAKSQISYRIREFSPSFRDGSLTYNIHADSSQGIIVQYS